jgi:hypothetical protein
MRRTAATGMADIGVQPHIIEAVLNHVGGHKAGVAGIYNRSTYAAEKRAALDVWRTTSGSPSCRPQIQALPPTQIIEGIQRGTNLLTDFVFRIDVLKSVNQRGIFGT